MASSTATLSKAVADAVLETRRVATRQGYAVAEGGSGLGEPFRDARILATT